MNELYNKAKLSWGACMPRQISGLHYRDDEHVYNALIDVLNDVTSTNWTTDAKIAWALMQGRDPNSSR